MAQGNGYLSSIVNPAGEVTELTYDAGGLLQSLKDPRGSEHVFTYDGQGRLSRDANPAGGAKNLSRTDGTAGYSTSVTTELGKTSTYSVTTLSNGDHRRVRVLPDGNQVTQTDTAGGVTTLAYPDGTLVTRSQGPDPRFLMTAPVVSTNTTTPGGINLVVAATRSVTLTNPNDPSTLATATDTTKVNGNSYVRTYTAATRTVVTQSPVGRRTTVVLDDHGRVSSRQLPGVSAESFTYDSNGRLTTSTQGSRTYSIGHGANGYVSGVTDPLFRTQGYTRDSVGRVTRSDLPGGRSVAFGFDAGGNMTSLTPPGRLGHGFSYTAADQVSYYTPPFATGAGLLSTHYSYDIDGALVEIMLPDSSSVVPVYDTAGRLSSVTTSRGTTTVGYDTASRVHSLTTPEANGLIFGYDGALPTSEQSTGLIAGTVSRTFDNFFRTKTVSVNGASLGTLLYDADSLLTGAGGLVIGRESATGRVSSTTAGVVATAQDYNTYGELANFSATASGGTSYSYSLPRDNAGRIATKSETVQGISHSYVYGYDGAGRLATVTRDGTVVESYSYDDNGNRLSGTTSTGTAGGTYDDQDRMTAYGAATYTYGAAGDLRTKTVGSQTTTYSYDALGNLMGAWLPDGRVIEYVADGLNRRVGRKVNGALTEGFLHDGQLRPVAWLDGAGAVKATFVYGLKVNVPESMTTAAGTFRILTDHLGSPRLVVDTTTGAVAQRMDYDSFGQVLTDTSPGFQPFGFAGGLYDRDTGLVKFGARDYDPSVGRWTNKDPIRFNGGLNLYVYASGDPVNWVDPFGNTFLMFDTANGVLHVDPEQPGRAAYDLSATSGRGTSMNDQSAAGNPWSGPLPPGQYLVDTPNLSNPSRVGDILRNLTGNWGDWRVPLIPYAGTDTLGRGGFFLHGGSRKGSAGCVNFGGGLFGDPTTDQLLQDLLASPTSQVPLVVY